MYLLTYIGSGGLHAVEFGQIEDSEASFERLLLRRQVPELFERRGNDWIRIRPEEG